MSYATEVIADSPELWWDTRQSVGTAQPDASGNGHTGTISGAPTLGADGLEFTGTELVTGDDEAIGTGTVSQFALEVVVRDVTFGGSSFVCGFEATTGYIELYATASGGNKFRTQYRTTGAGVGYAVAAGSTASLTNVLTEYDGTTLSTYIDGVLIGSTSPPLPPFMTTGPVVFYAGGDGFGDNITALIQHAIFYDHDLGPTRAAAHFAALSSTPPIVDSLTPSEGTTAGGTSVVIAGSAFTGTTDVDFGVTPAASFVEDSDSQITAVSPAHVAGTVQVIVTTPEGASG